jgi:hypothetical protein
MLIQAGESLAYVEEQQGHSSVTITVDTHRPLSLEQIEPPWIASMM